MGCGKSKPSGVATGNDPNNGPPQPLSQASDGVIAAALRQKRKGNNVVIFGESSAIADSASMPAKKSVPKPDNVRALLFQALKDNVFFAEFAANELEALVDGMEPREVAAGTVVIKQGDPGDNFYIIEQGKFDIIVGDRKVADWGDGTKNRAFGELALLYNLPRAATVKSQTPSKLWFIDRLTFRHIIARASKAQTTRLRNALRKGILEDLSELQLEALTAAATIVKYNAGDAIIKKGEDGEVFFIIESGSVICKNIGGDQSNNILTAGDYFGERALLRKGEKRAADVEALSEVSLIALHREDFEAHLGHLKDLLEYNIGMRLLLCTPLIGALSEEARQELFTQLSVASYADGAVIAAQGRKCDSFFLVKDASVVVRHMTVQQPGSSSSSSSSSSLSSPRLKSSRDLKEGLSNEAAVAATPVPVPPGSGLKPSGGSFLTRSLSRMNVLGAARDPAASVGNEGEAGGAVSASSVQAAIAAAGNSPAHGASAARLSSVGSRLDLGAAALDRTGSFSSRSQVTNADGAVIINNDLGILEPGHWFPDRELDSDAPLPASFVAKGEAQVFVLDRETYLKLIAPVKTKLVAEGRLRSPTAAMVSSVAGGSGSGIYGPGLVSQPSMSRLGSSRNLSSGSGSFIGLPSPQSSARGGGGNTLGPISEDQPAGSSSGAQQQAPPLARQPSAKPGALSSSASASMLSSTSLPTPTAGTVASGTGALAGLPVKPSTPVSGSTGASKEPIAGQPGPRSSLPGKDAATPMRESKEAATPQRPEAKEAEEKDAQRGGRSSLPSGTGVPTEASRHGSTGGAGTMPQPQQQPQAQPSKPPSGATSSAGGTPAPVPVVASRPKEARRFSTEHKAPGAAGPSGGSTAGSAAPSPAPATLPPATRKRLGIPIKELDLKQTLGTGTFGRVRLAFHKKTGQVYALKMLQKQQIAALKQQKNIQNERDILWRVDHPFIIRLYDTYKDRDRLYMLLELVQGGELFGRLQHSPTQGRIRADEARFYAACVLDAFEYLHALHVVYRDLKPENLLIDSQGYLKLVDFGFAKFVTDKTFTLCGTPEYLAPELVLGRGHDKGVDYWAIGVLLFEQVAGYSPFADRAHNDQLVICKNILKGVVEFPPHFKDRDLQNVILQLLVKDIPKRLGCLKGGAGDIKAHPFFRSVDWERLRRKELVAPWKPVIRNILDTSNFDDYDEKDDVAPFTGEGGWDKDF